MTTAKLDTMTLPEFGLPTVQPALSADIYRQRIERALARAQAAGLDALVIYGDREHMANLAYLSGYDPRFEESLLILTPGREPLLVVGLEGWGYAQLSPAPIKRALYAGFSLLGMPRDKGSTLDQIFTGEGIGPGSHVGLVGWKYFGPDEADEPQSWIEVPAFITDLLRRLTGGMSRVVNATSLFMAPENGLRIDNELDQLAAFEFVSTYSSQAVRNVLFGVRPGMTEFEAVALMKAPGLPLSAHTAVSSGPRAALGLPSPMLKVIERGEFVFASLGLWGSLNARGGFLIEDAHELPESIRDYVDKMVAPYFAAVAAWYEHIGIGVTGGELFEVVHSRLSDPFFGVGLNPGHYIHLDEWLHSPISAGSAIRLRSGMALQVDIIPATGGPYLTTNVEDGIALADESLRAGFEQRYPEAWGRIQARRRFMQETLGIRLKPEVLPFSNIPAYLPPYLLRPDRAMRMVE